MKKKYILSVLIFSALFIAICNQTSVAQIVKAGSWEEFVAEDKSYKILFPQQTEADKKQLTLAKKMLRQQGEEIGPTHQIVLSGDMSYSVSFSDYPAPMVDEMERNARYLLALDKLPPKTKDVFVQNHPGVETEFEKREGKITYQLIFRVFIVEQRKFALSVTVPALDKLPTSRRKIYQGKVDKFFDSFVVLNIPAAKYEPIPLLPKDFKVSLKGQLFQSELLGLSVQFPTSWTTEIHEPNRELAPHEKEASLLLRWFWRDRDGLFGAKSPTKEAGFAINIYRRTSANATLQEFVEELATVMGSDFLSKVKTPLSVKSVTVNGRKFLMFEQFDK